MTRVIEIVVSPKGETTVTPKDSPARPAAMPANSSSRHWESGGRSG